MRKIMSTLLIVVLVLTGGLFALVRYLESNAVFFPGKNVFMLPDRAGMAYEDIMITTSDGVRINAWFVKNPSAKSTLIFAHGNAGCMSDRMLKIKFFHDLGLNVLIFDYRGYGRSEGKPTEQGVYKDAQAAYDYLLGRKDVDPAKIAAYGTSLGGIVAVDLATQRPLAALIVDSSITSGRDVARIYYPYVPHFFMQIKFDSLSKVARIHIPKLFMHSPDDKTVPFAMGQRLFAAAAEPKQFVQSSGGHNEIQIVSDPLTAKAVKDFFIAQGLL